MLSEAKYFQVFGIEFLFKLIPAPIRLYFAHITLPSNFTIELQTRETLILENPGQR